MIIFGVLVVLAFVVVISKLNQLEDRVDALQKKSFTQNAPISATPHATPAAISAEAISAVQKPVSAPQASPWPAASIGQASTSTSAVPSPSMASTVSTPRPVSASQTSSQDSEFNIGGKVFLAVGVLAVLIGIGFLLRYAFENNIITPIMRFVLGVVLGIAVSSLGMWLRRRFEAYGQSLFGAGLGILYISIYAGYSFYALFGAPLAVTLLLLLTAFGVLLALQINSLALVTYAFIGAFLVAFIFPLSASVHTVFVYLLILSAAVIGVSAFKKWPALTLGSLLGSSAVILKWIYGPYTESVYFATAVYLTILFLIYFLADFLGYTSDENDQALQKDQAAGVKNVGEGIRSVEGFLIGGIPVLYVLLYLSLVHTKDAVTAVVFALGVFYVLVSFVVRALYNDRLSGLSFSNNTIVIGSVALVLATALHFDGSTLTLLLAAEAAVLVFLGYFNRTVSLRVLGLFLSAGTVLRLLVVDMIFGQTPLMAVFNKRTVVFALVTALFLAIWFAYKKFFVIDGTAGAPSDDEQKVARIIGVLGIFALPVVWMTIEVQHFVTYSTYYLPLVWMGFVTLMVSISFVAKEKLFRILSYVLLTVSLVTTFIFMWSLPADLYLPFFNLRTLQVLVILIVVSLILSLYKVYEKELGEDERGLHVPLLFVANGMTLIVGSIEILDYFNQGGSAMAFAQENMKRVVLSCFWLGYAIATLFVGIAQKSAFARYLSIFLFAISIFKIFLYDTVNLSDIYRFVSYISLGVILLLASYFYYRFKDRILGFVKAEEGK